MTSSQVGDLVIGQVFTPESGAKWMIERWGILEAWLSGATICDPTAGQGALIISLMRLAVQGGVTLTPELVSRLTLIEIDPELLESFRGRVKAEFDIEFPESGILCLDVITDTPGLKFDILIGNPPWANFADLPDFYKDKIRENFVIEGLVPDKRKVLLGSSRVDLSALVLKVVLGKLLNHRGIGCFFLPTSLFFGDGAHRGFRNYRSNSREFKVDKVYEFTKTQVFHGVKTGYCCVRFQMDCPPVFPVAYLRESAADEWTEHQAMPLARRDDQWRIVEAGQSTEIENSLCINLAPEQTPRQGVNTCGANSVYIFDSKPDFLPNEQLFPLMTKEVWRSDGFLEPRKWILLPYDKDSGRVLTWSQIEKSRNLADYLLSFREKLENRKGTMIQSSIRKGVWWALLGVGPYCFAPYKIVWEAYGRQVFNPIIASSFQGQLWQGNQAMHAFIPCWSEKRAREVHSLLQNPSIPLLLRQLNGEGKCNWAQPGKIKKILTFSQVPDAQLDVFSETRY